MYSLSKYIPNSVTSTIGRQVLKGQKHSPVILFATGVVGVVAAAVMASKATLKLEEVIEESKDDLYRAETLYKAERIDYNEKDYQRDVAIIYTRRVVSISKLYAPAVTVGLFSIAALTGSHYILTKRNVALISAYATLDKAFTEYRGRVIEDLGEKADEKYRHDPDNRLPSSRKAANDTSEEIVLRSPSGYARFFDETCQDWDKIPEYNLLFLRAKQNYCNDQLRSRGHIFLNEVYDMLGMERSREGSVVGWVLGADGDNYVDFGIYDKNNERKRAFVNGLEGAILLDFNVDGLIYDKIDNRNRRTR
jgi:hypothetical protein